MTMKKIRLCAALLGLMAGGSAMATETNACMSRAQAVLAALDAGDFDRARVDFNAAMQSGLSAEQLRAVWQSLPGQVGPRVTVATGRLQSGPTAETAIIPIQHEKAWLELQVSCAEEHISGLFVRPGQAPAAASEPQADAGTYSERELDVQSAGFTLPGTLTLPKAPVLAGMVLVHGSGAHDRDESIGPNKVFRDLAHGLAAQGIAVLRYEKRSRAHAASFAGQAFSVKEEVVDDAAAAVLLLGQQPELAGRPVYLLGHSLGALLAPRIAAQAQTVAGMVLLAAPARALTEMIPQQMNYISQLDGSVSAEEEAAAAKIQAELSRIDALTDANAADTDLILGAPAAYWLDLRSYSPFVLARSLGKPILLLQGDRDYQVTISDDYLPWQRRMKGVRHYSTKSFPGLNHLFMTAGDPPGPSDYEKPGHVDGQVIQTIADWVQALNPGATP